MISTRNNLPVAVTCGDPAGIGPDILLQLPQHYPNTGLVLLADYNLLQQRAEMLGVNINLPRWQPSDPAPSQPVVWHHPLDLAAIAGQPNSGNGSAVIKLLDNAANGCLNGLFSAMVTAPLSKHVIAEHALPGFTGHTEYLAELAAVERVVMMLAGAKLRVALATTHLPLRQVANAIDSESLTQTLTILANDLTRHFGISSPRILVLGLNPHAGESGDLGDEEIRIIAPTLAQLRQQGMQLTGPLPADTAFQPDLLATHDVVLAMYHDQGLPVLKYASFGNAINITLGLPFIRTSVDHGTAFALAGSGKANPGSLFAAVDQALSLSSLN